MPVKQVMTKGRVPVKIYTDDIESSAYDQLQQMSEMPFIHSHIAVMPDVHMGRGATVGSVIPTRGAIIPAAVGVDIGCGMNAVRTTLTAEQLPDSLRRARSAIEAAVPVGMDSHRHPAVPRSTLNALMPRIDALYGRHRKLKGMVKRPFDTWACQLGTLGGGNHFIELCLDEAGAVWIMLHSGSRGVGNAIGRYFIALARRDLERLEVRLPHRDLAYFEEGAEHFDDYMEAVDWAQDYAYANRREMMRLVVRALEGVLPPFAATKEAVNCHHNYVARETHFGADVYVTRKGAIRAGVDELGIIPGSMGARSYIVRGRGSATAFESCAHGAGRKMSRTKARKRFDTDMLAEQTAGVECRKDKGVLDEAPGAYKDIDAVMAHQDDLVDIVHTLKQVLCVKG